MNTYSILLPDGSAAIVDRADMALVLGFEWRRTGDGYVGAQHRQMFVYLHRLVAGAGPDESIDHRNGDRLDNRLGNLRVADRSQNGANRPKDRLARGATSVFKGVSWKAERSKWVAHVHVDGKTKYLGSFDSEEAAARAYNDAALLAWGEFARLNVLPEGSAHVGA